ncbi:MAG: 3-deoxy-7-phosphoheptulonate synthase [Candidatus Pacearchaeota archaeon]|jgi:3-deoxy-7-phosphoheptulonate synthase
MEIFNSLISPEELIKEIPTSIAVIENVKKSRQEIKDILDGKDKRKIFVIGPCSIHNFNEALKYAEKLKNLQEKVKDRVLLLMRVYLEKPRTSSGWKGFINDPDLNESYNIEKGLKLSRELLIKIIELGVPCATEFLEILVYPYIQDLISWGAIGARTTESPVHRQIVSGMDIPIGFKNLTSGDIDSAINAIIFSSNPNHFIGIDINGKVSKISTSGNKYCNLVLRGGITGPNYEDEFVEESQKRLKEKAISEKIFIDCNHGNSLKDYSRQPDVFREVVAQMIKNTNLIGVMLESNINEGKQIIPEDLKQLKEGVSVTDGCISFEVTEKLILEAYSIL